MAQRFTTFLTEIWKKQKAFLGIQLIFFRTNNSECVSSRVYAGKALPDLNIWFLENTHINSRKKETKGTLSLSHTHIPEVFWLKLMALNAHNDGFLSVNVFPINLRRKWKNKAFKCGLSCDLTIQRCVRCVRRPNIRCRLHWDSDP